MRNQMLAHGREIIRKDGVGHLLRRIPPAIYRRTIRPHLPVVDYAERNGVPVIERKPFDDVLPSRYWHFASPDPDYEQTLVSLHQTVTQPGDDVVIIGGGWGVTMVHAYNAVGENGSVIVYEGSDHQVANLRNLKGRLNLDDRCQIVHAIVSDGINLDSSSSAPVTLVGDLPACDVLEIDCEGAERSVLEGLEDRPRDIYLELHPHLLDSPAERVLDEVQVRGYETAGMFGDRGSELTAGEFDQLLSYEYGPDVPRQTPIGAVYPPIVWVRHGGTSESVP